MVHPSGAIDVASPAGTLAGYLARPAVQAPILPGLIICHGFPAGGVGAANAGATHPELAERIAAETGFASLALSFRGAGTSAGDFSLAGWLEDIEAAVDHITNLEVIEGVWLAGFGTGGALCVCAGARRREIRGVAALGAPADFDDWASHPRRLLRHAREVGAISSDGFPRAFDDWARELRDIRPVVSAPGLGPRPLLVVHGSEDEAVTPFDARVIGDAHGSAELRIISGAGHGLRFDPRAVALLVGWLERQHHPGR